MYSFNYASLYFQLTHSPNHKKCLEKKIWNPSRDIRRNKPTFFSHRFIPFVFLFHDKRHKQFVSAKNNKFAKARLSHSLFISFWISFSQRPNFSSARIISFWKFPAWILMFCLCLCLHEFLCSVYVYVYMNSYVLFMFLLTWILMFCLCLLWIWTLAMSFRAIITNCRINRKPNIETYLHYLVLMKNR